MHFPRSRGAGAVYLTHARLMRESERAVHEAAIDACARERRVCGQLIADTSRYALWRMRHDHRMMPVATLRRRELQILELRRACVEQVHRAALVRYLRDSNVTGAARDRTLRLFYGVVDARWAAVLEHRNFLVAASSQVCSTELLALAGDTQGAELIHHYELAYAQYMGLFCERARATEHREHYLLGDLLPEVKGVATRLRHRIVGGHLLPVRTTVRAMPAVQRMRGSPSRPRHAGGSGE